MHVNKDWKGNWTNIFFLFFIYFFLVLPVYCYQPISLHPRAHMLSHVIPWTSAPDSSVHGFFQARILEWVAISFSMNQYFKSRFYSSLVKVFFFFLCKLLEITWRKIMVWIGVTTLPRWFLKILFPVVYVLV